MHVEIPEYLYPKLKKASTHLNMPLSELVADALIAYLQDLEDIESAKLASPYDVLLPLSKSGGEKKASLLKTYSLES